ncbi:MAG: hypothetical protein AB1515_04440 [Nitrospirota bacterium]
MMKRFMVMLCGLAAGAAFAADLPGLRTTEAPWPLEITHLRERLRLTGLPALESEGTNFHVHPHLDLFINGKPLQVPPAIGINPVARFISPIHTHDETGVIHIESFTAGPFTLGQFFDVWGVRLTDACLGGYCNAGEKKLRVHVNGKPVNSNFREIVLANDQAIVVSYGTLTELPDPIPSTFKGP